MSQTPTKSPKAIKSVALSEAQKNYVKKVFEMNGGNLTEAGLKLKISDNTLSRLMDRGSCAEKTYAKLFGKKALIAHRAAKV